jgi:hypothetical protein
MVREREGLIVIDLEALETESEALKQRSAELTGLLDAGHPVTGGAPGVWAESRRLGAAAHQARRDVAARVAAGLDPGAGVTVGRHPPVRQVKTDSKGRDLDPLGGRTVITPELVAYWTYQRDVVAEAVEGVYRQAAAERPYRDALVAAARGHIELLRDRRTSLGEGGVELEAALGRYDNAFVALRQAANDARAIATEAQNRLDSLKREAASAVLGDDVIKGFLANAFSSVSDTGLVDPDTAMPLVTAKAAG